MGKKVQHKRSSIPVDHNHQGCMWGVLHVLHYHRWRCVKKMIPHRRRSSGKDDVGLENLVNEIKPTDAGEMQENVSTETDNSLGEEKTKEPSPVTKRSMKSRIKALISEEVSKRRIRHRRSSSYPTPTQLIRTNSIHHLEPLNLDLPAEAALIDDTPGVFHQSGEETCAASTSDILQSESCEERVASSKSCELCATILAMSYLGQSQVYEHEKQPVEYHTVDCKKLNKAKQDVMDQKLVVSTEPKASQSLDSLDIFNIEKDLFLKILQSSPLVHHFHRKRVFNSKMGISKSVSFPLVGSSGRRYVGPSKLKHNQEIKSRAKGEKKFNAESQAEMSGELESKKDITEHSLSRREEYRVDCIPRPCLARSDSFDKLSPGSPVQLKNSPENTVVYKRFKDLRRKIKHAIKESKKERHRITMDAILHKIPYGHRFSKGMKEDRADLLKEATTDRNSKYSPKSSCERIRRTSSLDESLDRYCKLFECSFNREAKHHIAERIKSREEEKRSSGGSSPKSLDRILSLPDLRGYLQNEESPNAISSGISTLGRGSSRFDEQKNLGSEDRTVLESNEEIGSQEIGESYLTTKDEVGLSSTANDEAKARVDRTLDDLGNVTTGENASRDDHETPHTTKMSEPSPSSVLDCNFQEDITSPENPSTSEGLEFTPRRISFDDVDTWDSSADQQDEVGMDAPTLADSKLDLYMKQFNIDSEDIAEFNYVRDVLELSGFSRNEFLGTWHAVDQPLDPSVFEEMEGCLLHDIDYPENDEVANINNLLLFDLINEVLLEIYERSFTYCPIRLSFRSQIHPMPVGFHVLEEVWANISWCLSWKPEFDQSLDDAVSRDLAKRDGWMNLQFDAECVGLELEDMIFDDLLEELIST